MTNLQMGRSIRNKPKSAGGSAVTDTQLATKADAATVSSLEATVNTKASITNVSPATAGELTGLTINDVPYTIPSGGGGGASTLDDLTDVSASGPSDGQALVYDSSLSQWKPGTVATSGVSSNISVTYGGSVPLGVQSVTHGTVADPDGEITLTNGLKLSSNWYHSTDADKHVHELFDGSVGSNDHYQANPNGPTHTNGVYNDYVWVDIEFTNPTRVTNLKMWASYYDHYSGREYFPRQFAWFGQSGTPASKNTYSTTGAYVAPTVDTYTSGTNTLTNWTALTTLYTTSTGYTKPSSTTPTTSNHAYSQSVSDPDKYDRIRLLIKQGGDFGDDDFLIGQVQIDGTQSVAAATDLADIDNVSSATPSDGQALVYDSASSQWQPGTVASSGGTTVVANPSTTPTTDLTKVTIGGTDYNVGQQRNYQYKQIETVHTSTLDSTWRDVNGFTGSTNSLQITTTSDNPTIRIHYIIRGEPDFDANFYLLFRLNRTVGGATTNLNAPTVSAGGANYIPTLTTVEQGYYSNNHDTTMDTWEIYYMDTITANAGSIVTYVPQLRINDSHVGSFTLNRVSDTASVGAGHENTISVAECEEILTGPAASIQPLFSQQDSIMHEEGTVNFKIVLVFDAESGSTSTSEVQEPDLNDVYTAHYQRIGGRCRMTCSLPIDHASASSDSAAFLLELVSPPSWMTFPTDGPYVDQYDASYYPTNTTIRTYKTSKFSGSVQSRKMQTNSDFANSISEGSIYVNSSNRLSVRVDNVSGHLSELSFLCDFELTNGGSSPYYRIPSLRANYAYREVTANDTTSFSVAQNYVNINGFGDTSITTSSSNSKIRVNMILRGDADFNPVSSRIRFERVIDGTTTIINAPTVSGRDATLSSTPAPDVTTDTTMASWNVLFVDELSVGSGTVVTYRPQMSPNTFSNVYFYLNKTKNSGTDNENTISFIELQEIDAAPQLSNVSTTGAQAGQALVYNSSNQWVPSRTLLPFGWQVTLYGWTSNYSASGTSFTFPMPTTSGTSDVASTSTLWGINKYGNYMDTDATDDVMLLEANARYFLTCSFNITTTSQRRYFRLELFSSSTSNGAKTLLHRAPNGGVDRSSGTMYHNYANSFTFETGSTPYVQLRARSEHSTSTFHGYNEPNKNQINIFRV